MIETGTLLQNRYRVESRVGQGGMGAVFLARDERFGSRVAVKQTLFDDPTLRKAFEREAHLLNRLCHGALPKVSDHFTEGDGQFLVMEYIEGSDLGELLERRGAPFPAADVRGFTRLSEHAPPERVVQLLNRYFTAMTEIIFAHGRTLDKFIGDGLMALFGAPNVTPRDAANALTAAVAMQRQMIALNAELRAEGLSEIGVGTGLHTGEATVGYIGSERRSEYTAIGDTVNLASRLESTAKAGQILISAAAADAAATHAHFKLNRQPPVTVKNRVQPAEIFEADWRGSAA